MSNTLPPACLVKPPQGKPFGAKHWSVACIDSLKLGSRQDLDFRKNGLKHPAITSHYHFNPRSWDIFVGG